MSSEAVLSRRVATCPHCQVRIFVEPKHFLVGKDNQGSWGLEASCCPACGRFFFTLVSGTAHRDGHGVFHGISPVLRSSLVHPKTHGRPPCPPQVPPELKEDYDEACLVLPDSPKASAALSRRCLQHLLHTAAGVQHGNLAAAIQQVLDGHDLPTHLAESVDAIRNIGNLGAHPERYEHTGEIVEVEPGEAEWTLEVLELLFDFYYVLPATTEERRAALNKKLHEAGKPPMK